jgi:integrase
MANGRRGKGEGTIGRTTDGRWVARLETGRGPDGKRRRKALYGTSRPEVQDKLRRALTAKDQGTLPTGKRQTVGQYLAGWLETVNKRPSTMRYYRQKVETYLVPSIGHVQLDKLTPEHVERMLRAKSEAGLSAQSCNHMRAVLRTALAKAVKNGYVYRNVASLADAPQVQRYEAKFLTPEQARAFLAAAKGERFEALFSVALSLGLRPGEALGLQWPDIDLDAGRLTVNRALQRVPGRGLVLVEPKTKKSRATLPLAPSLVENLRRHRQAQLEARLLMGSSWRPSDHVFTNMYGGPLELGVVHKGFRRVLAKAGLERIRPYDLRHSCGSLLLAQGVPLRVVMEILRHSTITLTANTYAHVMDQALVDAADKMEAVLG